jgi:CHAD domain-containing protein
LKKAVQRDYIKERIKSVSDLLSLFVKDQNLEALHQMRVEVKKANSLLKLQEFNIPKTKTLYFFRPIKKIFKKAGLIREAQLNLENLESFQIQDEKMKLRLQNIVQKETEHFLSKTGDFEDQVNKSLKKTLKRIEAVQEEKALDFYRFHLNLAAKNLKRKLFINHLHESRKSLKVLIHLHEIPAFGQIGDLQLNWSYLDLLQDNIGKWHDLHRTGFWMKRNKANKNSLKTIQSILKGQLAEIRELKKDFEIKALNLNGNGH